MKNYGELVREGIRKAYEVAAAKAAEKEAAAKATKEQETEPKKFVVGETYSTRSICNHDCVYTYEVLKKTPKTVTVRDKFGREKRCKIHVDDRKGENREFIYPDGKYSMCPVITA